MITSKGVVGGGPDPWRGGLGRDKELTMFSVDSVDTGLCTLAPLAPLAPCWPPPAPRHTKQLRTINPFPSQYKQDSLSAQPAHSDQRYTTIDYFQSWVKNNFSVFK